MKLIISGLFLSVILSACTSHPAIEVNNICTVLDEEVSWYKAVKKTQKKWGVSKSLQLAFIHQESHFASDARPPGKLLLGFLPWVSSSSAYGFGQVKRKTWEWYQLKTGNTDSYRDNFADVTDFIGWYVSWHSQRLNISKNDVYNQYLAYHEGHNGFENKSYQDKQWLIKVAKSVRKTANQYKSQLKQCQKSLNANYSWSFF